MTNSIEQLSAKLEELDKRLKALSTTQNISIAVMNMRDYIHETKTFLSDLLSAYQNHISTSNNYSQQIENLQTQLNQISQKIDSILSAENFDPNQITSDIEALQNSLSTLSAESADAIQNLQNQISENSQNISNVSTTLNQTTATANQNQAAIQSLTTQTTNLQTAQTNLSTTQTNLTSTVANLNSRLTSAEQEITALNGGVDLTELNDRLTAVENGDVAINYYTFKYEKLGFTPSDSILYTREFCYNSDKECTLVYYDLNYVSAGSGTLTINLYHNKQVVKTYNIELSLHPNNCRIFFEYIPTHKGQTSYLKLTSTTNIKYENIIFSVTGKKVKIVKYWNEIFATCFDGKVYLTRFYDDCAKYGKFSNIAEIDLDNLPYTIDYEPECLRAYFAYKVTTSSAGTFTSCTDMIVKENINDKMSFLYFDDISTQTETAENKIVKVANTPPSCNMCSNNYATIVIDGIPYSYRPYVAGSLSKISTLYSKGDEWLAVYQSEKPTSIIGETSYSPTFFITLGLKDDGYFYATYNNNSNTKIDKIAKGEFATIYIKPDESRNIYIINNNIAYKYNLIKDINSNISPALIMQIDDCDCVFELINNTILKHIVSTNKWEFEIISSE